MRQILPLVGTYRLQMNADFTFANAADIVDYLHELGISHLYLSPVLSSRAKSNHGYDLVDPTKISEDRGGEKGFDQLMKASAIQSPPLGVVLDIVPNHMAASGENPYFADVIRDGPHSKYARLFDIYPAERKRAPLLSLPFLGSPLSEVLAANLLQISFDQRNGFYLRYYENRFSISYQSISRIIFRFIDAISEGAYFAKGEITELKKLCVALEREQLKKKPDFAGHIAHLHQWFLQSSLRSSQLKEFLRTAPLLFISDILKHQHFSLEFWKTGKTNYRRFFDVNELIATRMQDDFVFDLFHKRLSQLFSKYSTLQGLRVDHIDGLALPEAYLDKLSSINDQIWVEKILASNEELPYEWKAIGTSGYEFLNKLNQIFVNTTHFATFEKLHQQRNSAFKDYESCERQSRRHVIDELFKSDFERLGLALKNTLAKHRIAITNDDVYVLVRELAVALPRYRTYVTNDRMSEEDSTLLAKVLSIVRKRVPATIKSVVDFLIANLSAFREWLERFQQFSGAGLAKGVEDTAFYRYFPCLALNEVGGHPTPSNEPHLDLHQFLIKRCEHTPLSLNASSTHDTKRSEDARSRLLALSWHPQEWEKQVKKWEKANLSHKTQIKGRAAPNSATEYFVYQTVLSVFPLDGRVDALWIERVKNYLTKALREAKLNSDWRNPNVAYEAATLQFIEKLEYPLMQKFIAQISEESAYISLAALTLKILGPGVPDFYQGCELWDFSLVDPDNRRKVDYELRRETLDELIKRSKSPRRQFLDWLQVNWESGAIKLWLTRELLHLRRDNYAIFERGDYSALQTKGPRHSELFAFSRHHEGKWVAVIAPTARHLSALEDNYLLLPKDAPALWNFLEQKPCKPEGRWLNLEGQSTGLPIILTNDPRL